jgi:hypothetical protein
LCTFCLDSHPGHKTINVFKYADKLRTELLENLKPLENPFFLIENELSQKRQTTLDEFNEIKKKLDLLEDQWNKLKEKKEKIEFTKISLKEEIMGLGIMELIEKENLQSFKQRMKNNILQVYPEAYPKKLTWSLLPQNKQQDPQGSTFAVNEPCSFEEIANLWAKAFGFNRAVSWEGEIEKNLGNQHLYYLPTKKSSIKEAVWYISWCTSALYPVVRNITVT